MAFFDPTRPAYVSDPYPSLARLRHEDPVHWSAKFSAWVTTRYIESAEVLRDSRRFTSNPCETTGERAAAITAYRESMPLGMVRSLGTTSGEAHRELRRLVNPVFSPAATRHAQSGIERMVEATLDGVPRGVRFDFMERFANPLPRQVVGAAMGLPVDGAENLQRMLSVIEVTRSGGMGSSNARAEATAAQAAAVAVIDRQAAEHLQAGTVLHALVAARAGSDGLSLEDVTSMAAHIATVGADPTTGAIANALLALVAHPEQMVRLRREPRTARLGMHEFLRYDCPTHIAPRFVTMDTTLGGKRVRKGDSVLVVVGAANRDPAAFPTPDVLDLERDARRQLGFGQGEHICLGAPLALAIMEAAINGLLCRFGHIALEAPPEYGPSIDLRVPQRVFLRCD